MIDKSSFQKRECILLSCVLHGVLLLLLSLHQTQFLSLTPKKSTPVVVYQKAQPIQPPAPKKIDPLTAPLLEVPCVLYRPGDPTSSLKKGGVKTPIPTTPPLPNENKTLNIDKKTHVEPLSQSKSSDADYVKKDVAKNFTKTSQASDNTTQSQVIDTVKSATFLDTKPVELPIKKENTTNDTTIALTMDRIVDTTPSSQKTDSQNETNDLRKKKLTIADLFKNLSTTLPLHSISSEDEGEGQGAPAVIVQGDIRYHSFTKELLENINSTSKCNNNGARIRSLYAAGKIKQNLKLSITLAKSGKVIDARILVSSGCQEFDDYWVATAYQSSPFAPLPSHFKRDMVRVELVTQL